MKKYRIYCSIFSILVFVSLYFNTVHARESIKWVDIDLIDRPGSVSATGISNSQNGRYPVCNLFDGDRKTCWVSRFQEGKDNPTLLVRLPDPDRTTVNIFPGYGKSESLFFQNARPKTIEFSIYAAVNPSGYVTELATSYKAAQFPEQVSFHVTDAFRMQSVPLSFSKKDLSAFMNVVSQQYDAAFKLPKSDSCLILKIEITEARPGTKYDDICISEISFSDRFISSKPSPGSKIKNVYLNADENTLLKDDGDHKGVSVYTDPLSVLQIIEVSKNKNWAILISMPAEIQGRAETFYLLADLLNNEIVNPRLEEMTGEHIGGSPLYFETDKNGALYVSFDTIDGEHRKIELR